MAAEAARDVIFEAASKGDAGVVARMLDEDAYLLSVTSVTYPGFTLLSGAISKRHLGVARLLLERGIDINSRDVSGNAALEYVAMHGSEDFAALLLTNGADPTGRGNARKTALMYAAMNGRLAVLRLFLWHLGGRGLDERTEDGLTAVWYACRNGRVEALRTLLLSGADHTIASDRGRSPQAIAHDNNHHECAAVIQVSTPSIVTFNTF
jgi:ankyrin repeat protein